MVVRLVVLCPAPIAPWSFTAATPSSDANIVDGVDKAECVLG